MTIVIGNDAMIGLVIRAARRAGSMTAKHRAIMTSTIPARYGLTIPPNSIEITLIATAVRVNRQKSSTASSRGLITGMRRRRDQTRATTAVCASRIARSTQSLAGSTYVAPR